MRCILGPMSDAEPTPAGPRRLALHACCAPCLIEPFEAFAAEGNRITVVYYNPNIHPAEEYERRLMTLREYAARHAIDVVELPYDPDAWWHAVAGSSNRRERCAKCYQLRLSVVSRWAAEHGYPAVSTTLTVSPYQDAGAIASQGELASSEVGVTFLKRDFRDRYGEATRRSREEGMYRQNYCGCMASKEEADAERAQRTADRKAARVRPVTEG